MGTPSVAIEIFRALEGLFPDDAVTLMNLALVYEERARQLEKLEDEGEAEEYQGLAFEAYKAALAADPTEPDHPLQRRLLLPPPAVLRESAGAPRRCLHKTGSDEKRVREATADHPGDRRPRG